MVVSPGFIDPHTHADSFLTSDNRGQFGGRRRSVRLAHYRLADRTKADISGDVDAEFPPFHTIEQPGYIDRAARLAATVRSVKDRGDTLHHPRKIEPHLGEAKTIHLC
jgi:hypothetical protein